MKILNFIQQKIVSTFAICLFIISVTWMLVESISREFLSKSFNFSEEVVIFSLVWAVLLTLGESGLKNYHVSVDLFANKLKGRGRRISRILVYIISSFYALFLIYAGVDYIQHLYNTGITSSSSLKLPMYFVFLSVPVGFFFLFLYYIQKLIEEIKRR